jgi:hypothetical protein
MHRLAEMGWVVTQPGDDAMTSEPANYRIRFLEITTVDAEDREPKAGYDDKNREEVIKKAQEFASTPMDREDELNPVETDIEGSDDNQKGIGKEKDGEQPEGKPKGSSKKVQDSLQEFTGTGSMGTAMSQGQPFIVPPLATKGKGGSLGGKFKTPRQWKVKQPVVDQQVKRKVNSESEETPEQRAQNFLNEGDPIGVPEGDEDFNNSAEEDDEQQAYRDAMSELESGECVVFSDRGSGPTTVTFSGRQLGRIGVEFDSWDEALAAVEAESERSKFWPNIYHINDHGNVSQLDPRGNVINAWV